MPKFRGHWANIGMVKPKEILILKKEIPRNIVNF